MARKKRSSKLRPKKPSRIRKKRRGSGRSHHHPELIGLALVAFGAFLGFVLYGDWAAGHVGSRVTDGLSALVGDAVYLLPVGCAAVGMLMLVRSRLVDVRPFRLGLAVTSLGVLLVLGDAHGGYAGQTVEAAFAWLIGSSGVLILGVFTLLAGILLLTGASVGALVRRSQSVVRTVHERATTRRAAQPRAADVIPLPTPAGPPPPLVDGAHDYPDITEPEVEPPPLATFDDEPFEETQSSLFDVSDAIPSVYRLPDRTILRKSRAVPGASAEASERVAATLVAALANFGVDATVIGEISGPRVTRYELQLAPGTKVAKVAALKDDLSYALATTEIRILAPIPGKQAVGVEVPNVSPEPRDTRGRLRRPAPVGEPALRLARQGHLGQRDLGRPRAHAAPADRRHHRLGQVRLHQHDPHVDPLSFDARRGTDDPRRPEAHRARLLRIDPASSDFGRVEPEAGRRGAGPRRGRDGAPLRDA